MHTCILAHRPCDPLLTLACELFASQVGIPSTSSIECPKDWLTAPNATPKVVDAASAASAEGGVSANEHTIELTSYNSPSPPTVASPEVRLARRTPMNLHQPVHLASSPPRLLLASLLAHFASSSPVHLPASPRPRLPTFPRPLLLASSRSLLLASSRPGLPASSPLPLSSHLLSPPRLPSSLPPRHRGTSAPRSRDCRAWHVGMAGHVRREDRP